MTDDTTGSVSKGRDLFEQLHPTAEQREAARAKAPQPKRGEKSIAAGRALHDNKGKFAPDYFDGTGE
ncbi:hypothetical protein [Microbacterium sp. VKM Ac-2923]|uniref:hypothetical protein n=1 Tax=Microbacterium sp. VKM Ac-2923 TaxID=2929476 RepID=UPI001FB35D76|nr:hypothetical protein [Microbacterium sp. VKM Ac-2923]MCJ1708716.1 hypothetical protein [Microbacterium sp. VKM Ac-2923]